jgi:hypothetical protein
MTTLSTWNAAALDAGPALPSLACTVWGNAMGWALVLAYVTAVCTARTAPKLRWALVAVVALWALLPGPWSPGYWLGLTFRAPSIVACLLAARGLWAARSGAAWVKPPAGQFDYGPLAGLILGYVLLLDTLALLPMQVYAWGFEPLPVVLLGALAILPWLLPKTRMDAPARVSGWVLPLALALFAWTRWPSGNVWDAISDPCLCVYFHLHVWRQWRAMRDTGRSLPTV